MPSTLRPALLGAAVALGITAAVTVVHVSTAGASAATTIRADRAHVAQTDAVTLTGTAGATRVTIDRKIGKGGFHRLTTAHVKHGRYRVVTHPTAGATTTYRAGRRTVKVASTRCTPLAAHGTVAAWFEDRHVRTLATHWAQLFCSAARGSTITLAEMFVYENSSTVRNLMNALRTVHAYRGVHVRVILQRAHYYSNAQWTALRRHFSFAELHYCLHGCHSSASDAHAHTKFSVLSRTIFGGSAVLGSTANWSGNQLEQLSESGVYVYNDRTLTAAYNAEWSALIHHSRVVTAWHSAGSGIQYAFDPRPASEDAYAGELSTLRCRPGDSVHVVNAYLLRWSVVKQLNRLQSEGCGVDAIRHTTGTSGSTRFAVRYVPLHDKFFVITAHSASGAVRHEVLTGAEDLTTASMTLSDQQLFLLRRDDMYRAFRGWYSTLWRQAH